MAIKRWKAVCRYKTFGNTEAITYRFDEISQLQDLIESGPHWHDLLDVVITYELPKGNSNVEDMLYTQKTTQLH